MNEGKVTREPEGILKNVERNKKVTTSNRLEFIAWIAEEEFEALETDEETSKLETIIKLQTTRREIKRRTKEQRRDLTSRRNNEIHHAKLCIPIGLPQGGQASAPAWKFTANMLLKTQENINDDSLGEYLKAKDKEKEVQGVIKVINWEGQEFDLHGAALADDVTPIAGNAVMCQHRLEESQVAYQALLMRRKLPKCKVALIPRRQNQKQTETGIEMRDKVTGEKHEWKIVDQEAELALNGLTICRNEIKAHQLIKYRTELTQKAPSMVDRQMPNDEAKIMCDMLLEMKSKYGMVPSLDGKGAITSLEWLVWKEAAKKMKIHRSIPKPLTPEFARRKSAQKTRFERAKLPDLKRYKFSCGPKIGPCGAFALHAPHFRR
jgi:hypothetical protein